MCPAWCSTTLVLTYFFYITKYAQCFNLEALEFILMVFPSTDNDSSHD